MNSKRLNALASNVSEKDVVLDVGCDHGYLSLYLKENNLCKEVYASDISENALKSAQNNFKKHNVQIKTFVSDGFSNIPVFFDTAVIAGMGTNSILKIIDSEKTPRKLVLSSNNELFRLRKSLNKLGFKIIDERAILENNHYYSVMLVLKGRQRLNRKELLFGISNDDEYYQYLYDKNKELIPKVPFKKKIKLQYECILLKGLIERK